MEDPPRPSTVLTCLAPHPAGRKGKAGFVGELHRVRLQVAPFWMEPTGRIVGAYEAIAAGCMGVRCSSDDCKTDDGHRCITEYRILAHPGCTGIGCPCTLDGDMVGLAQVLGHLGNDPERIRNVLRQLPAEVIDQLRRNSER